MGSSASSGSGSSGYHEKQQPGNNPDGYGYKGRKLTPIETSLNPYSSEMWYIVQDGHENKDCTGAVLTRETYKLHCKPLNDTVSTRVVIDSDTDCSQGQILYYEDDPECQKPPTAMSPTHVSITAIISKMNDVPNVAGECTNGFELTCTNEAIPDTLPVISTSHKVLVARESTANCTSTREIEIEQKAFHLLEHVSILWLDDTALYTHIGTCNPDPGIVPNTTDPDGGYFKVSEIDDDVDVMFKHYPTIADCEADANSFFEERQSIGCAYHGNHSSEVFYLRVSLYDSSTLAEFSPSLCLWDHDCSDEKGSLPTGVPPNSCMPGTYCHEEVWWSQCRERPYDNAEEGCYATVNGPNSGPRWGCLEDSDCCNPDATCGTDRLCNLPCPNPAVLQPLKAAVGGGIQANNDVTVISAGVVAGILVLLLGLGATFLYRRRSEGKRAGLKGRMEMEMKTVLDDEIEIAVA